MNGIVVVYQDGKEYYYKPMGTEEISKKVREELAKHEGSEYPYNIARCGVLKINEDQKPNKDGYYTKDQVDFTIVEDGEFIKQYDTEFKDCKLRRRFDLKNGFIKETSI